MAADSLSIKVVLHFIILELLSRTYGGVQGRRRKLVSSWMAGPRSRQGRKEGTPNLRRRTQARLLVGLAIMSSMKLLFVRLMSGCNLEEAVSYSMMKLKDGDQLEQTGEGLIQVWLGNPEPLLMNTFLPSFAISCGSELPDRLMLIRNEAWVPFQNTECTSLQYLVCLPNIIQTCVGSGEYIHVHI